MSQIPPPYEVLAPMFGDLSSVVHDLPMPALLRQFSLLNASALRADWLA